MALAAVKGNRDASATIIKVSADLGGAWALYAQDNILSAPANTQYYMRKWIVVTGGSYRIVGFADDKMTMKIDGVTVGDFNMNTSPYIQFIVNLSAGVHLLDIYYTNVPANTPSYILYAFYRGSDPVAEFVSTPDDWLVDDSGEPPAPPKPNPLPVMNLPVWLPTPNWADPVVETYEWLTDVLSSESDAEQRRRIRRFPRRAVEASFLRTEEERQLLDISVMGLGKNTHLLPQFWDRVKITAPAAKDSLKLKGDFKDHWLYFPGALALVRGHDTFTYEVVAIASVTDTELTLAYALNNDWTGTCVSIYPLHRARILDTVSTEGYTRTVEKYSVRWEILDFINLEPSWGDAYVNPKNALPVITSWSHNWRDTLQFQMDRNVFLHDNMSGTSLVTDVAKTSYHNMRINVTLQGVTEHLKFTQLLYAMAGQQKAFQTSIMMDAMTPLYDIRADQGAIIVKQMGYSLMGGVLQDLRTWLVIELVNGTKHYTRVISTRVLEGEEWLFTENTFGNIPKENVRRICWCPVSRLGSDSVEIQHQTDINGVSEVVLAVRGFNSRRKATPIA